MSSYCTDNSCFRSWNCSVKSTIVVTLNIARRIISCEFVQCVNLKFRYSFTKPKKIQYINIGIPYNLKTNGVANDWIIICMFQEIQELKHTNNGFTSFIKPYCAQKTITIASVTKTIILKLINVCVIWLTVLHRIK